jgi:hypothetical protein
VEEQSMSTVRRDICLIATAPGCRAAGLSPCTWTIENIGHVDSYERQREDVRKAFAAAFETLVGEPVVITFSDEHEPPIAPPVAEIR